VLGVAEPRRQQRLRGQRDPDLQRGQEAPGQSPLGPVRRRRAARAERGLRQWHRRRLQWPSRRGVLLPGERRHVRWAATRQHALDDPELAPVGLDDRRLRALEQHPRGLQDDRPRARGPLHGGGAALGVQPRVGLRVVVRGPLGASGHAARVPHARRLHHPTPGAVSGRRRLLPRPPEPLASASVTLH
jgi:hypothetical protein